jgi:YD repeat-containing protein
MDKFGHVTEMVDARNVTSAELFGYGSSLPVALAHNARQNDIFQESFEVDVEAKCKFTGGNCGANPPSPGTYTNFSTLDKYSKTGARSIQVKNTVSKDVCFQVPALLTSKSYLASVWYYDESNGASTTDVNATRPGLFFGQPGVCSVEMFPNGKNAAAPPTSGQYGFAERATGSRTWKKVEVQLNSCGGSYDPSKVLACISASVGNTGIGVVYDELRIHPVDAQMSTYAYNALGKLISSADLNGTVTRFEYDVFGNLTGKRNDDGKLLSEQGKKYGKP